METYISLLRGINVSGKNLIKMIDLNEMYESLGYKHIKIYIQSGNVVFKKEETDVIILESEISSAILKRFNMNVPVIVKGKSVLKKIFAENPFLIENTESPDHLYVCILSKTPDKQLISKIEHNTYLPEEFYIKDDVIYLSFPDGYGRSKLNNNFFENKLKVNATTRNLKTLTSLIKISESL